MIQLSCLVSGIASKLSLSSSIVVAIIMVVYYAPSVAPALADQCAQNDIL